MRPICPDGIGPRAGVNSTTCSHSTFNHQPISPTPPTDPAASASARDAAESDEEDTAEGEDYVILSVEKAHTITRSEAFKLFRRAGTDFWRAEAIPPPSP